VAAVAWRAKKKRLCWADEQKKGGPRSKKLQFELNVKRKHLFSSKSCLKLKIQVQVSNLGAIFQLKFLHGRETTRSELQTTHLQVDFIDATLIQG
jgi:hypothetical protein